MRCFYHGEERAVAICKSCGRGICHGCYAEVGTSAACRNRCESDVAALNDVIERNKTAYQKTSAVYVRNGVFLLLMGLVFAGYGFANGFNGSSFLSFFTVFGLLFCVFGVSSFFTARRFRAK